MKTILLASLGVLLGLVLFVWLAWLWIKRRLKKFGQAIGEAFASAAQMPGLNLHLESLDADHERHSSELVTGLGEQLIARGFITAGRYAADPAEQSLVETFVHLEDRLLGLIYDPKDGPPFVELAAVQTDGQCWFANNGHVRRLDKPDWYHVRWDLEADIDQLLALFASFAPADVGQRVSVSPAQVKDLIQTAHRREALWRINRGGYREEEVRAMILQGGGTEPIEDGTFKTIRSSMSGAIASELEDELRESYLRGSNLSAAAWEEVSDRLQIIHPMTDAETMAFALYNLEAEVEATTDTADSESENSEIEDGEDWDTKHESLCQELQKQILVKGAILTFAEASAPNSPFQWPRSSELRHVASLRGPCPAEVYILPRDNSG